MDKSFALLRTNVGLTTNVKLVVTASYSLYLDSIDSNSTLNKVRYKKVSVRPTEDWSYKLRSFYTGTTPEIAYGIKDENDSKNMSTNFSNQYDDLYTYGAKNIVENKNYDEEFEYFAPLHVTKNKLPSSFIIFRVDGPGLLKLTKDNFRTEILNKMKVVNFFDLTRTSPLGLYLDKSINLEDRFTSGSIYVDFRRNQSSTWYGIDFENGGYNYKSESLESFFSKENTFFDTDKYFFESWKNKKLIYPYIFNFSFLFDDTPATPTSLRKWSLNRYMGFYFDKIELYEEVSPNDVTPLSDDVFIGPNNQLKTSSGNTPFSDPDTTTSFPFVEVEGIRYKVLECPCGGSTATTGKNQTNTNTSQDSTQRGVNKCYKIISDKNLEGKSLKPSVKKPNVIMVESVGGVNTIKFSDDTSYTITDFENYDMWLIQIGGKYHKLIKDVDTGNIQVYTDYAFRQTSTQFEYYINDPDKNYRTVLNLKNVSTGESLKFKIYRCQFTDVKDFDTDVVETKFAKFEYEKESEISRSEESKFFATNLNSISIPPDIHDFTLGNEVVYLPCSSHYTANNETFRLIKDNQSNKYILTDIWKKNSKFVKWGYQNSLSTGDTLYPLNNSILADDFNRTTNTTLTTPTNIEKNLDYFYSINSNSNSYTYHSVHVEDQSGGVINTDFTFDLDKYLGLSYSYDYFSYFFGKKNEYNAGKTIKNDKRWSIFNSNSFGESNSTLFKGIKFRFSKVGSISVGQRVASLTKQPTNDFTSYKFSIILSQNNINLQPKSDNLNKADFITKVNVLNWEKFYDWKTNTYYATQSVVRWNDMLFQTATSSKPTSVYATPINTKNWQLYSERNIFWSPLYDGSNKTTKNNVSESFGLSIPVVYNGNEYWYFNGSSEPKVNFWNPYKTYEKNTNLDKTSMLFKTNIRSSNSVIFDGRLYLSSIASNIERPHPDSTKWEDFDYDQVLKFEPNTWKKVPLWSVGKIYSIGNYVVYQKVLYSCKTAQISSQNPPSSLNPYWIRIHSFEANPSYQYGASFSSNDLVYINDKLYKCAEPDFIIPQTGVVLNKTLNDGVYVIINKKWKNVLINIYSNDNTLKDYLKNINRDKLYNDYCKKLVAKNFISYINEYDLNYGFINKLKYVIVEENGDVNIYDFNNLESVKKLPYVLEIIDPIDFGVLKNSLRPKALKIAENILKPNKVLDNGLITSKNRLNYYSDLPFANTIETTDIKVTPGANYNVQSGNQFYAMKRHNGLYSPIFHEIEMFKSNGLTQSYNNFKFDTELTNFGMTGERVISKVNRSSNILKLKNITTQESIFPMLDEFGYQITKSFIFKSTWDFEYHQECNVATPDILISAEKNVSLPEQTN